MGAIPVKGETTFEAIMGRLRACGWPAAVVEGGTADLGYILSFADAHIIC